MDPDQDSIKQAIKLAMLQKMTPEQQQAMLGQHAGGPVPGDMGHEGDMGGEPLPMDDASFGAQMGPAGQTMPPPQPPGPPMPPMPAQPSSMAAMAAQIVPGMEPGPPPPGAEERYAAGIGEMDAGIESSQQNNQALMERMGVTPEQLQAATARGRQINDPQASMQGPRSGTSQIAELLMKLGLKN